MSAALSLEQGWGDMAFTSGNGKSNVMGLSRKLCVVQRMSSEARAVATMNTLCARDATFPFAMIVGKQ